MRNEIWGEMQFHIGWKTKTKIKFLNKDWTVTVKAQAYKKEDGLTTAQENSFALYTKDQNELLARAQELLLDYDGNAAKNYQLQELLFKRDGSFALLLAAADDPDGGIAIELGPKLQILEQDDYL